MMGERRYYPAELDDRTPQERQRGRDEAQRRNDEHVQLLLASLAGTAPTWNPEDCQ